MKKSIIFLMLVCLMFTGYYAKNYAYAESADYVVENYIGLDIKNQIIDFVYGSGEANNERIDRVVGSEGEKSAAEYLKNKFIEYGYAPFYEEDYFDEFTLTYATENYSKSLNVAAIKKSNKETSDTIIVGAHIDNYRSEGGFLKGVSNSHGVYDNASGVVAMLNIARLLKDENLDFNIIFVGFGAEEVNQNGSIVFLSELLNTQKYKIDDIKLMINLDAIGSGENLYMYSDEVTTIHDKFFREMSKHLTSQYDIVNLKNNPLFKKTNYLSYFSNFSYSHMGLSSDNVTFLNSKINTINFFSGNWDAFGLGITESDKNKNIFHTSDDTLEYIDEVYGEKFYEKIESVVNIVVNSVKQQGFVEMLNKSSDQKFNYFIFSNSMYLKIGVIAIIIILLFVIRQKTKKIRSSDVESLKKAVLNNKVDEIIIE